MSGTTGGPPIDPPVVSGDLPPVELLRVDPTLLDLVASLFWAAFPTRRLGRAPPDADGRVPLTTDPPWVAADRQRWLAALGRLVQRRADAYLFLREVRDHAGRRDELLAPRSPGAYAGGAWLVGPFEGEAGARAWANTRLSATWLHDVHAHAGRWFVDVFSAGPDDAPSPDRIPN